MFSSNGFATNLHLDSVHRYQLQKRQAMRGSVLEKLTKISGHSSRQGGSVVELSGPTANAPTPAVHSAGSGTQPGMITRLPGHEDAEQEQGGTPDAAASPPEAVSIGTGSEWAALRRGPGESVNGGGGVGGTDNKSRSHRCMDSIAVPLPTGSGNRRFSALSISGR